MSAEAKKKDKERRVDADAFLDKATPEQLVQIANGTALRVQPLVKSFSNDKADDLRKLLRREFKDHADFRGMVLRKVAELRPAPKPKEEKAKDKGDKPKEDKGGKEDKPKEKKPEKAKQEKQEKPAEKAE